MMEDPRQKVINDTLRSLDAALGSPKTPNISISKPSRNEKQITLLETTLPPMDSYTEAADETSVTLLMQDDPGVKIAQVLFSEFIDIYVEHSSDSQIWDEIFAYEKVCAQQAEALWKIVKKVPRHHSTYAKSERMAIRLVGERNTWRLLRSLFHERLTQNGDEDDLPMIDTTKDRTDRAIISQLYDSSSFMREAQTVVDWLEKNAEDDYDTRSYDHVDYFGSTHVAWENTLQRLKRERENQRSAYSRGNTHNLVTSHDPDAPLRQSKHIHDLDQEEDERLIRSMFACVRTGQLSEAQELCAKSGQHWRAATLEGWKLFHDPNNNDYRERKPVQGNQYRDIWKATAWKAASDLRLIPEERALYGALCGHLPAMLLVCTKWEDQLWAYFRTLVDQRVEETLRGNSLHLRSLHALPNDYPEERLSLEGIFESIESRVDYQNVSPYHIVQKYLILNDIDGLIKTSHCWIGDSGHLLRFLTHLLLVLKSLGCISYEVQDQVTDILHACVEEAMERGDVEQVARYSSVLPDWLQTRSYADFLINICEEHHRKHALNLAALVGLDLAAITATVFAKIRLSPSTAMSNELIADTTAEDKVKINGLDWLLYDKNHRPEALRQANALIRHFLISRKVTAAKILFHKIPTDSVDVIIKLQEAKTGKPELPSAHENRVREYLCFKTFLDAQESFTEWFDHYHQKKPNPPKKPRTECSFQEQLAYEHASHQYNTDYEKWKHTLDLIAQKACERLYNVLLFPDGGWLVDLTPLPVEEEKREDEQEGGESFWSPFEEGRSLDMTSEDTTLLQHLRIANREPNRARQLTTLRSLYIPQVTSLLQNILHCTERYKECIQLVDLIASEQHTLYKCFGVGEMQRFLFKMQETCKDLLDRNFDALGYPLG